MGCPQEGALANTARTVHHEDARRGIVGEQTLDHPECTLTTHEARGVVIDGVGAKGIAGHELMLSRARAGAKGYGATRRRLASSVAPSARRTPVTSNGAVTSSPLGANAGSVVSATLKSAPVSLAGPSYATK